MRDLAVYIHWPFCAHKCPYCDFNSHVRNQIDQDAWAQGYLAELAYYRALTGPRRVTSVFFGGGTPSLMHPDVVGLLLDRINDLWGMVRNVEVTLEANPTSSEVGKFLAFKDSGINRLSIGIQSLNDDDLRFLGRQHSVAQGLATLDAAASIFDRFSFDLIYARPGQTMSDWERELARALPYARGHMSLYQLTIEPQTPFYTAHARGDFVVPGEGLAAELYALTDQMMGSAGMPAYEISNYATPGQESRHNLAYWRYDDYIGVGPGAHGRLTLGGVKYATRAHRAPEIWLERVGASGHGAHPFTVVPVADRGVEALMMGLRLRDGFDLAKLAHETGQAWENTIDPKRIKLLVENGDLIVTPAEDEELLSPDSGLRRNGKILATTLAGRLRLNQVIAYLLGA